MLTRDGGLTYSLVKKLGKPAGTPAGYVPTSGNFNGVRARPQLLENHFFVC